LHGFLSTAKQNSVARFVPVFTYADTAVYFNCLQSVDKRLAAAAVPDTFGGWQLGGARRDIERQQALAMFGEDSQSIPQSCYNRAAWVQNWNQFWKLVAARHENSEDDAWFAMFDIANFYDSIDLRRLETSVRAVSPGFHFPINVLFHLLRTWNRGHCLYSESTKGLPMDVVGDCSRLLANFYLTSFDLEFREYVTGQGGDYMRFADDMVVRGRSAQECREFIFHASEDLHRLGLNINVAKVRYCSKLEFNTFWGFVIMDRFESGEIYDGLRLLDEFVARDEFGRKGTVLKRAITLVARLDGGEATIWKQWVRESAVAEELPLQLSREQILAFIKLYDEPSQALSKLVPMFLEQPFSQPKAILLQVLQEHRHDPSDVIQSLRHTTRASISALHDPVLDLCTSTLDDQ
jgi:hypothetical protein